MKFLSFSMIVLISSWTQAGEKIELKTTTIKGNKELPKILYLVPWQDAEDDELKSQKLMLHSLFTDLYEPLLPDAPANNMSVRTRISTDAN